MAPPDAHNPSPSSSEAIIMPSSSSSSKLPPPPPHVDVNSIPAMVYTYTINHADGSSAFPYVSEYCETMFGFTAEHLMSHPETLMNAVHKDDSEKFTKVRSIWIVFCSTVYLLQSR